MWWEMIANKIHNEAQDNILLKGEERQFSNVDVVPREWMMRTLGVRLGPRPRLIYVIV